MSNTVHEYMYQKQINFYLYPVASSRADEVTVKHC